MLSTKRWEGVREMEHRVSQKELGNGHRARSEQFLLATYFELRRVASSILKRESSNQVTRPTALVHDAAVRVLGRTRATFNDREHFFRTMVREMRRVLIDAARRRKHRNHASMDSCAAIVDETTSSLDLAAILTLNEALEAIERIDPARAQVAELHLVGGLTHKEIATVMSISERTVERKWAYARSQLAVALDPDQP
jgi:RNA polymerase sigma factor (TIGR02999 family)